jgi:hypothetical protein
MTADETMSDVVAAVAVAEARRTGLMQFIGHDGASWYLLAEGSPPIVGVPALAVALPESDPMGVAKRILGAKMSGLTVPQAVLALVNADRKPDPRPKPATKATLAATVSPPTPPPSSPPSPSPKPAPVPHEVRAPATNQRELW